MDVNVLTGSQGTAPSDNFDPLEYWIEGAHKRGMELHAWVNPLRATKSNNASLAGLANTNPAKQHPEYCVSIVTEIIIIIRHFRS